jgi:septal ring factor EnvC (AmiA/AmiB activator)
MDKKKWVWEWNFEWISKRELREKLAASEVEVARLTQKCRERSNECVLLETQLAALHAEIDAAKRAYREVRRDVPLQIMEGKDPAAVHEARREYENNRLRVFVNTMHREASGMLTAIANLNKDLQRAKVAVAGGLLPDAPTNPG